MLSQCESKREPVRLFECFCARFVARRFECKVTQLDNNTRHGALFRCFNSRLTTKCSAVVFSLSLILARVSLPPGELYRALF